MSDKVEPQDIVSPHEFEWPNVPVVYLTVDYECDYGTALSDNSYGALEETPWLVSLIEQLNIPLTCFTQTKVFHEKPEQVERLRSASTPVSFHPHSHTHRPRDETDMEKEILKATEVYEDFFQKSPVGYRFPNGNVRSMDYELLAKHDYKFDASVFPSWRPGHFDNTNAPTQPQLFADYDLFEIPFTVYSDRIRIPTALSYCRLLGRPFSKLLVRSPPPVIIFNIHMHDLINPPAFEELSSMYRLIYSRNTAAKPLLKRILTHLQESGYEFRQIDNLYEELRNRQ